MIKNRLIQAAFQIPFQVIHCKPQVVSKRPIRKEVFEILPKSATIRNKSCFSQQCLAMACLFEVYQYQKSWLIEASPGHWWCGPSHGDGYVWWGGPFLFWDHIHQPGEIVLAGRNSHIHSGQEDWDQGGGFRIQHFDHAVDGSEMLRGLWFL